MPQVYYGEYEELEHTARTPSSGQVNDILINFGFVHVACITSDFSHALVSWYKVDVSLSCLHFHLVHYFDEELIRS